MADDWPQWLGASRSGEWTENGILESFPDDGLKLLWKSRIAGGYSGPAVADGKAYVMDFKSDGPAGELLADESGNVPRNRNFARSHRMGEERVHCFDAKTGKTLWRSEYACQNTSVELYAIGPRATPTVDGEYVYCLGAEGDLKCLKTEDGNLVWEKSFTADYGVETPTWGWSCCPLVDGDKLICFVGGKNSTCVAFDKRSGKELWRALDAPEPGYCSPVIHNISGRRTLLVWDSHALSGLDPETGAVYWSVQFPPTFAMSIGVPRVKNNSIFIMAFSRKSCRIDVAANATATNATATNATGSAELSAKIVWEGGPKKGIGGVHNTAWIEDGFIFGCGNGGNYICASLETGERQWNSYKPVGASRPIAWGNVFTIKHQDRFFLANDIGELILANMSPQGYQELGRTKLIEPTHQVSNRMLVWSHPAFANKCIYLRNDNEIRCYSLAREDYP